ncbi:hypothetical protein JW905_15705, partial [bacterium]|nr:hypothetical protein [candidate division CSSED10-310 bacterium]
PDADRAAVTAAIQQSLADFQLNEGSWNFFPGFNGGEDTLVVYSITLRLAGAVMGSKLATKILNSLSSENMPRVIASLREEVMDRKN